MRIKITHIIIFVSFSAISLSAQDKKQSKFNGSTNLQVQYDSGSDRNIITSTLEGFYNDPWGNTFFFVDFDYPLHRYGKAFNSVDGTYFEVARCLNFWQGSALGAFSLQLEYNGGVYRTYNIANSYLAGVDYFIHSKDFRNTFNFKLLYKYISGNSDYLPLQFTFVWGMKDLFGLKGLQFCGFADLWGENHTLYNSHGGVMITPEQSKFVFLSEPQLWYCVGRHFGCDNLNIGGEVELSYDFGTSKGFWARPCLGLKWVF